VPSRGYPPAHPAGDPRQGPGTADGGATPAFRAAVSRARAALPWFARAARRPLAAGAAIVLGLDALLVSLPSVLLLAGPTAGTRTWAGMPARTREAFQAGLGLDLPIVSISAPVVLGLLALACWRCGARVRLLRAAAVPVAVAACFTIAPAVNLPYWAALLILSLLAAAALAAGAVPSDRMLAGAWSVTGAATALVAAAWSLTSPQVTIEVTAGLLAVSVGVAAAQRSAVSAVTSALLAVAAATGLAEATALAYGLPARQAGLPVLGVAALAQLAAIWLARVRPSGPRDPGPANPDVPAAAWAPASAPGAGQPVPGGTPVAGGWPPAGPVPGGWVPGASPVPGGGVLGPAAEVVVGWQAGANQAGRDPRAAVPGGRPQGSARGILGQIRLAVEIAGWVAAVTGLAMTLDGPGSASLGLLGVGTLLLVMATRPAREVLAAFGLAACSIAFLTWLGTPGLPAPEPFALSAAALVLAAGALRMRWSPAIGSWAGYGPGLAIGLAPSLVAAWADHGLTRALVLCLAGTGLALAGARARMQAPLVLGVTVAVLAAARELAPVASRLNGWIYVALLGLLLLGAGATYEARIRDLRRLGAALRRLR
jgi:hypothetical protein